MHHTLVDLLNQGEYIPSACGVSCRHHLSCFLVLFSPAVNLIISNLKRTRLLPYILILSFLFWCRTSNRSIGMRQMPLNISALAARKYVTISTQGQVGCKLPIKVFGPCFN